MQSTKKIDIRSLSPEQLAQHFKDMGEPAFRAKQVYQWLWEKSARDFEQMSNLSKDLRKKLAENYTINAVEINNAQFSNDHTIKNAFRLITASIKFPYTNF